MDAEQVEPGEEGGEPRRVAAVMARRAWKLVFLDLVDRSGKIEPPARGGSAPGPSLTSTLATSARRRPGPPRRRSAEEPFLADDGSSRSPGSSPPAAREPPRGSAET